MDIKNSKEHPIEKNSDAHTPSDLEHASEFAFPAPTDQEALSRLHQISDCNVKGFPEDVLHECVPLPFCPG